MRASLAVAMACLALVPACGLRPARAMPPIWMLARSLPPPMPPPAPSMPATPATAAGGAGRLVGLSPGLQCRAAIAAAEQQSGIPPHLMAAIARVESGRRDGQSGRIDPWPWSINAEGTDHVYRTRPEAVAAVRMLQAEGARSIDVGCMQISLLFHPDAFASLDDAFDPARNAAYAARFLTALRAQTGSWATAVAQYHSATPELGAEYRGRVMAVLPDEQLGGWQLGGWDTADAAAAPPSRGAFMLSNHSAGLRILPLPAGAVGRGLAAYRAAPIPIASRVALR